MNGLGMGLGLQRFAQNAIPFIPPDDLDISGRVFTSSQVDTYLIHHAFTLETQNNFLKIKGNGNPTSRSNDARQWLYNHVVAIDTNEDFVELI